MIDIRDKLGMIPCCSLQAEVMLATNKELVDRHDRKAKDIYTASFPMPDYNEDRINYPVPYRLQGCQLLDTASNLCLLPPYSSSGHRVSLLELVNFFFYFLWKYFLTRTCGIPDEMVGTQPGYSI